MLTLVLGGARSGKSGYAQRWAEASGLSVVYVATAQAQDTEMAERIARHQAERPAHWLTREIPLQPQQAFAGAECVLLDCLTLWLSNWLGREDEAGFATAREALLTAAAEFAGDATRQLIVVANEVGLGIIPMGALTRRFVDEAGWLNQAIAARADTVVLMAAGLPMVMKGVGNA